MEEWRNGHLKDIATIIMGQSPEGKYCSTDSNGTPLLNGPTEFGLKAPTPVQYTTIPKKISQKEDILFCVRGSTTGRMNWSDREYAIGRGLAAIRHKSGVTYQYYLRGLLDYVLPSLLLETTGSTFPNISKDQLDNAETQIPPLSEQKAIAAVLSSLDDKIDLLHRQNSTLESMAEALFRQWFVVEAKDDWEEGIIDNAVSIKGGTTPNTDNAAYWNGSLCWSTPRDLSKHNSVFLFDTERKITESGLAQISSGLLPQDTVLLSSRAPIGYIAISAVPIAINQGYIAIICDKKVTPYFIYLWCKHNLEEIKSAGNGSTFQEISKSVFKQLPITIPPKNKLDMFSEIVKPTFDRIKNNQIQTRTLEKLRDTLLPKLMNGEVQVTL